MDVKEPSATNASLTNKEIGRLDRLRDRCEILKARLNGQLAEGQKTEIRMELSALEWAIEKCEGGVSETEKPVAWRWHWRAGDEPDVWAYSEHPIKSDDHRHAEPLYASPSATVKLDPHCELPAAVAAEIERYDNALGYTMNAPTYRANLYAFAEFVMAQATPSAKLSPNVGPNGESSEKMARIVSAYICANNYINAMADSSVPPESLEKIRQTYHEAVRAV